MTTAATYSSTEKKRIRKSFAKRASVLNVPFLLATQLESYTAFLQASVAAERRKNEGLQAAFTSIFPISSHSGNARLDRKSTRLNSSHSSISYAVFCLKKKKKKKKRHTKRIRRPHLHAWWSRVEVVRE